MNRMGVDPTYDDIQNWFTIGRDVKIETVQRTLLNGHPLDPLTGGPAPLPEPNRVGQNKRVRGNNQTEYADHYRKQESDNQIDRKVSDAVTTIGSESLIDRLDHDTVSVSTRVGPHHPVGLSVELPEGQTEAQALEVYQTYNFAHHYDPMLPITKKRQDIVDMVESNEVTIVQGETGSGKTTQVPQYILDHYRNNNRYCNIIVTQPRRIAAISIARRVCAERNWTVGQLCGYHIGMENKSGTDTRLLYCTTGVLLAKLIAAKNMHQYTHVILDEVHERDEESDFCLLVVKKFLNTNSNDVKVVLMSATFDTKLFASYYARLISGKLELAPVVIIKGKSYDVAEYYLDDLSELGIPMVEHNQGPCLPRELLEMAGRLIEHLDKLEPQIAERGSVLIFLPGIGEIEDMDNVLRSLTPKLKLWIKALHSTITADEQISVFRTAPEGHRKVIMSTNIAESSITIPDIVYVIDFCLTKTNVCDKDTNFSSLQLQWASKANCIQRSGRAGRVAQGRVYRLISHRFWRERMYDYGTPEMQRCSLDHLVLKTKKLDIGEPKAILGLALAPPNLDDIERTILSLKEVGALRILRAGEFNPHDGQLTFLGRVLVDLPVDIRMGKLMMLGHVFGLLEECIIISACTGLKSFFAQPFKSNLMTYRYKLQWSGDSFSDCIAYVNAYRKWQYLSSTGRFYEKKAELKWGKENNIQIRRIEDVAKQVEELRKRLRKFNIITPQGPMYKPPDLNHLETRLILKLVLCGAFYPNYFLQTTGDPSLAPREISGHNPSTTVMVKGVPANQGTRYRSQLETKFAWCDDGRMPRIHFEATKAFIEFQRDPTDKLSMNKILPAVFRAIKMRHSRETANMTITTVTDRNETPNPATSDVKSSGSDDDGACVPRTAEMPPPTQQFIDIANLEVMECGHFWARPQYENNHPMVELLHQQHIRIQNFVLQQEHAVHKTDFKVGDYCLALYSEPGERFYYRARIQKMHVGRAEVKVFFVDFGNCCQMPTTDLRRIDPSLFKLPFQAMEFELASIRPSVIKCPGGQWTPEATKKFISTVREAQKSAAKIFSIVHDVIRCELHLEINGEPFSANDELVSMNYADRAEESHLSKLSRIQRDQFFTIGRSNGLSDSSFVASDRSRDLRSACQEKERLLEANKNASTRGQHMIILQGPTSPYEVGYSSVTYIGKLRPTHIANDSVNSVSLNTDPNISSPRMMVAAYVGLNPNVTALTARDTTLMPDVAGLFPLIALVFTPIAEFRTDRQRTKYTGALCGLGWDAQSPDGEAVLPENDMEIAFDIKFDEEDIKLINQVRIAINLSIGSEGNVASWTQDAIISIQGTARLKLMTLLKKRREEVEPVVFGCPYKWGQADPAHLNAPRMEDINAEMCLLNFHFIHDLCVPQPVEVSPSNITTTGRTQPLEVTLSPVQKMEHQRLLEQAAASGSSDRSQSYCQLCKLMTYSARELAYHLKSVGHRRNQPLI